MNAWFLSFFLSLSVAEETVRFAALIYRHGQRTPVDPYPTDPWRNESLWPVKFGELTNVGKMQHYAFGQWLRRRYSHLLSNEFDPTEIIVRSTDVDRTLMSAQANLAGLYPPVGKSIWNDDLMWQPIPIHTTPEKQDEILAMKKPCVAYAKEMDKLVHSSAFKYRLSKYQTLMDYLTVYTGRVIKNYADISSIYSNLDIETLFNFTLPNWTKGVYPDKLQEPACYDFSLSAATPTLARLKAGPLLQDILSKMNTLLPKKFAPLKVAMYSGHDFTVGTVLTALGLFDNKCPVFTSTILIELISDNYTANDYIQISYRNFTETAEPYILSIPHCGKKCPLERFMKLYENLLTVDFDYECGIQFPALVEVSFCIGFVLLLTVYLAYKIYFTKQFQKNVGFPITYAKIQNVTAGTEK